MQQSLPLTTDSPILQASHSEIPEMKTVLYNVFMNHPIDILMKDYHCNLDNIKIKLNQTYIADAWIGYLEVWLNHYDEISMNDAIDFMVKLCEHPIQIYFQQLVDSI